MTRLNFYRAIAFVAFAFAVVLLFPGCAIATFENRLTCTVAGDRTFVASMYGPVGVTTEVSPKDKVCFVVPIR